MNTNAKPSPISVEEDDCEDLSTGDLPAPVFVPKDEVERRHSMDIISAKKNVPLVGSSPPTVEAAPKINDSKKKEEKKEHEISPSRSNPQPVAPKVVKDEPSINSSPNKKSKKGKSDENGKGLILVLSLHFSNYFYNSSKQRKRNVWQKTAADG